MWCSLCTFWSHLEKNRWLKRKVCIRVWQHCHLQCSLLLIHIHTLLVCIHLQMPNSTLQCLIQNPSKTASTLMQFMVTLQHYLQTISNDKSTSSQSRWCEAVNCKLPTIRVATVIQMLVPPQVSSLQSLCITLTWTSLYDPNITKNLQPPAALHKGLRY